MGRPQSPHCFPLCLSNPRSASNSCLSTPPLISGFLEKIFFRPFLGPQVSVIDGWMSRMNLLLGTPNYFMDQAEFSGLFFPFPTSSQRFQEQSLTLPRIFVEAAAPNQSSSGSALFDSVRLVLSFPLLPGACFNPLKTPFRPPEVSDQRTSILPRSQLDFF